jgi:arylsulfatase A-like enzyme
MTSANRPNILLITSDQQHWNTLGKRFPEIHTPNLDRLAEQGMLFRRAYCPNPTCTPTRASLITGQYPSRHGAWSLGTKLPESVPTVGDSFHAAGYDTALIGKAHFQQLVSTPEHPSLESYPLLRDLNFWKNYTKPFYGFRHIELARNHCDECHVGQHYAAWMEEKGLSNWQDHFQNQWGPHSFGEPANPPQHHHWTLPEEYHLNTWIAERTNARIDHAVAEQKPFFIWASFFDPHPPYLVPAPWDTMYDPAKLTVPAPTPGEFDKAPPHIQATQTPKPDFSAYQETPYANHGLHCHLHDREKVAANIAVYYGMVSMMDKYIGRILDHLDATGQADNTLVVFTSDHGHYYGHHGLIAKGPFHYDDGIRVPFIARWPGHIPAGVETDALVSLIDLPVTFLRAAGAPVPPSMQGVDQSPAFADPAVAARDHVLCEHRHQPTTIHLKTLVTPTHKLTVYYNREYGELYDLVADPGEINNLWAEPSARELREALTRKLLFAEMGSEPMPMPRVSVA